MKNRPLWHALKNRTRALATHRYATPALALVSFCESSFFLVPPDVMLAPMALADRTRRWRLAFICTLASVLGAVLGYMIGYALFDLLGQPIINAYQAAAGFEKFQLFYDDWGFWVVVISAVSFIPFKIATIASGVVGLHPMIFLAACLAGRAVRFYGVVLVVTTDPRKILARPQNLATLLLAGTAGVLLAALAFEHIGGLAPCPLCLDQRLPYYAALALTPVIIYMAWRDKSCAAYIGLATLAVLYLISAGLGIYHAGIEWQFWVGPASCAGAIGADNTASVTALQAALQNPAAPPCDQAPWRLFGLSLAGYNALASLGLAGLASYPFWRKVKCKNA